MPNMKQELQEMIDLAIEIGRPESEVQHWREELAKYEPQTREMIRAKQDAFLSSLKAMK